MGEIDWDTAAVEQLGALGCLILYFDWRYPLDFIAHDLIGFLDDLMDIDRRLAFSMLDSKLGKSRRRENPKASILKIDLIIPYLEGVPLPPA
jgi:hypothetical protein